MEIRVIRLILVSVIAFLGTTLAAAAEVTANGFLVRHERVIAAPPARVYEALVGQIGFWWNPQHTYTGDSKNLSIDPRAGGCFCERLPNGGVEHMRVVALKTNEMLRLIGSLGPLQASGVTGSMTWLISPAEKGSTLTLTYSVGGFIAGGFEGVAPAVDRVIGEQVDRLKRYIETGTPSDAK